MCGIECVFGKIDNTVISIFKEMLDAGKIRGDHATGVAAISNSFHNPTWKILKKAVSGSDFVKQYRRDIFAGLMQGNKQALYGHNRFKTMGANTDANAHPFAYDNIVGIHNGVLSYSTLKNLPTKSRLEVDSAQLFNSIDQSGVDESISEIQGDWALVWWDKRVNKHFFLRNSGRPLWYRFSEDKETMWVLSEPAMGDWLIGRTNHKLSDDEDWRPFKVNTLYSLDAQEGELELKVERTVNGKEYEWHSSSSNSYTPRSNVPYSVNSLHRSTSNNVVPFTGPTRPTQTTAFSTKFKDIEGVPIYTFEELRELPSISIDELLSRSIEARSTLKCNNAIDAINLASEPWSSQATWRQSHKDRVATVVNAMAATLEKLEVLAKYIATLEGQVMRHKLFDEHLKPRTVEEAKPKPPVLDIEVGASVQYDVENEEESTVHTLQVIPTKDREEFSKHVEESPQDHLRDFVGDGFSIIPTGDLEGSVVLAWTKGQNLDDVDHVDTCKRVHKWLDHLVMGKLKSYFKDESRRDDYIDNFDKAVTVRSYGMDWKAPSSLWVTKPIARKMVFTFSQKAVEYGVTNRYLSPFIHAQKLLEMKPPIEEAA